MKKSMFILFLVIFNFSVIYAEKSNDNTIINLPERQKNLNTDIIQSLENRKSTREYSDKKIDTQTLSTILWAGIGINRKDGGRTTPLAFGKNFMDIYVADGNGIYLYNAEKNQLILQVSGDFKSELAKSGFVKKADKILIIAADISKLPFYLGKEYRKQMAYSNSGTIAQNIYLVSGSLGIGTCYVAYTNDKGIRKSLKIKDDDIIFTNVMPLGFKLK